MEGLLYTRGTVFLLSLVGMWLIETSLAIASNFPSADVGSNEDQNYLFYQRSEFPRDCHEALRGCHSLNSSGVYVIKPEGYPDPFDVYCHNDASSSGWTVIQRRIGGHLQFSRLWEDFRDGFGFLSNEFWLGNEKLSYLTNQGLYELRVDLQLSDGSSFHVTYSGFRISDEWGEYWLVDLGEYLSHGEGVITPCPRNMVYGNCTCQGTCEEPNGSSSCPRDCDLGIEGCYCPTGFLMSGDECVPWSGCSCFWPEVNVVIPNGQSQVNSNCTKRRSCINNQLTDKEDYQCGSDARCAVRGGMRQCYCNDGFRGDGQNCDPLYTDCYDAFTAGHEEDGVYLIKPTNWPGSAFNVSCVMSTNGGGWTVFQRRTDGHTNFYRNWTSYREGFGSFDGDFWLGNEKIHYLTNQKAYKFRVDYVNAGDTARYEEYSTFSIGAEDDKYRLTATGPSGTAGPGLQYNHGDAFSTYDSDNDECGVHNFAERLRGAWWYGDSYHCSWSRSSDGRCYCFPFDGKKGWITHSNLNGDYNGASGQNIFWYYTHTDCNLNFAEMKIRPSG